MVDYDARLHSVYAAGRGLDAAALGKWMQGFAELAPRARPLVVVDLGAGIGRFTPALAETFGGPVYGVEPSARMRQQAIEGAAHPQVTYLDGSAEAIPLPDASCDLALVFLAFHHFADQLQGLKELRRVLRPGGVVLLRTKFADLMPDLAWYKYFPSARQVDAGMYLTLAQTQDLAEQAGLSADAEPTWLTAVGPRTLKELHERIRTRALSTFEHLQTDEVEAGFAEFEQEALADPDRQLPTQPAAVLRLSNGR